MAMDEEAVAALAGQLDLVWLVVAAALVGLMQAGFLCLESGLTRAKDSINVAVKNTADFALTVALYWLFGFGLMFGPTAAGWVGAGDFAPELTEPWDAAFFVFQAVFCGAAATIVSGACAGRTRFPVYLAVSALLGAAVYPLFGHWAWGGALGGDAAAPGWLARMGFVDFAGSTVVHSVGGWAALATALAVGPRRGRFGPPGSSGAAGRAPRPSNPALAHLGALLLLVGWFGFNAGSTLGVDAAVGPIAARTLLAACAGTIAAGLAAALRDHLRALRSGRDGVWRVDAVELLNGMLGGLVAVTAGCAHLSAVGAAAVGLVAGPLVVFGSGLLVRWKIDDAVGAVPVHAFCGVWGTLAIPLLAPAAVVADVGLSRPVWFAVQTAGVVACAALTSGAIYPALRLLRRFTPLRVSAAAEAQGLNFSEHGASTDLWELFDAMEPHRRGESLRPVAVEPYSEAAPVATQYNRVLAAFGASQARVRTEAARVGAILAGATEPIVAADSAGRIVEFNPAAERAFRRRRGAVLGRNLGILFAAGERRRLGRAFRAVLRGGGLSGEAVRVRAEAVRADGATYPAEVSVSVADVTDAGGTDAGREGNGHGPVLTLFVADVSARREAEERRRAQLAAETADRAKTQFLAHISHEIRTPLNALVGFADLLLDGADEDPVERREHLRAIRRSGEHLTGLIGDVLDLSRIEAGRAEVRRQRCEPHPVIAGVVSMLRMRAAQKGLELDFDWAGPVPEAVWTDTTRLRQIVVNLIGNAVKFTARGSVRVTASLRMPGEIPEAGGSAPATLRIAVADTGPGVSADELEMIFEPFKQTEAGESTPGGSGLGLAISREFAVLLGGGLTAASLPGRGSTFTLEIDAGPADRLTLHDQAPDDAAAGDLNRPAGPPGGSGTATAGLTKLPRCRILVADDGEANRKLLDRALRRAGADVVCVPDGRAAVDAVFPTGDSTGGPTGDPFDAVLMDVQMPVLDGLGATRELRRLGYAGPVLAVTAQALAGDRERCRDAGCTDHVPKPLDLRALLATLAELLGEGSAGPPGPDAFEPDADFDPDLLDLRDEYREEMLRDVAELIALCAAETGGSADRPAVARIAHKVAGSAGTFGFPRTSAAARALERVAGSDASADLAPLLDALHAALPHAPAAAVGGAVARGVDAERVPQKTEAAPLSC